MIRRVSVTTAVVLALFFATRAEAQYANRSLGIGVGYTNLIGGDDNAGLGFLLPLTLEGHLYIENGFDLFLNIPLMIVQSAVGVTDTNGGGLVFGTGGELGVRYLFMEGNFRPWLGVQIVGLVVLRNPTTVLGGGGVVGGLDYFVTDSTSIGVRAFFNIYAELNVAPTFGPGAAASVNFYF